MNKKSTSELISIITNADTVHGLTLLENNDGAAGLYTLGKEMIALDPNFKGRRAGKLAAAIELGKRINESQRPRKKKMSDALDVYHLLKNEMQHLEHEVFKVLLLGGRNELLKVIDVASGQRDSCVVHSSDIFRNALINKACGIILVHNHPSGNPSPSPEDCAMTRKVVSGGKLIGINVLDHIIIGKDSYLSLREEGLIG